MSAPRGLKNFIRDIRNCGTKEEEKKRVNVELANIRVKFKQSDKLSHYDRKKYVWKLLYIYMLGYDVEFGHMEAVELISSPKYAEKQVGYMVTSVLLNEHHEFLRLVINSIKIDITSRNDTFQALGLVLVANVGGKEFAESLAADVQRLLVSGTVRPVIRKKAALCLLRLFRRNPDVLNKDEWADSLLTLLDERDFGLLTSVLSFLHGLVMTDNSSFRACLPKVVHLLERLVKNQDVPADYMYYSLPSPWMQIKCMRILQQFPIADDPSLAGALAEVLQRVVSAGGDAVKNINKSNAMQAVLVEAVGLVMLLERDGLVDQCAVQLGKFISAKEPNTRYLGLENMGRLSALPQVAAAVRRNQPQIAESLHDPDISIRRRALDLLYGMCDANNAQGIVQQLLDYLVVSDFAIREELVLKIAILAEKFAPSVQQAQRWYVDVVLALIDKAGDFVSDDIWHRVVQIVTNTSELQHYAAEQVLIKLRAGSAHETMVKIAGYILGEFGHLLHVPCVEYFALLQTRFPSCSLPTKALLLSAYAKLVTHTTDPAFAEQIATVFQRYHAFADVELQQRSVEYFSLTQLHQSTLKEVLAEMPKFPERASALERRVAGGDQEVPESQQDLSRPSMPEVLAPQPAALQSLVDLGEVYASTAPAPRPAPMNALDLLSQLEEPRAQPAADLLGGLDDFLGGGKVVPAAPATATPVLPLQDPQAWLNKLVTADSGVLYEDPYVQLGVKNEWRQNQGRITLFLGNKYTSPLASLRAEVHQVEGLRVDLFALPALVGAGQQVTVQLAVACVAAFAAPPSLTLAYTLADTQQHVSFRLRLPVFATKFLGPAPAMEKTAFYESWRTLAGAQKLESILQVNASLTSLPAWHSLLRALRLSVLPDVDPNPLNLFAASTLCAESMPLCIVRLESDARNAAQFRLTVASRDAALAAAIKACILPLCA